MNPDQCIFFQLAKAGQAGSRYWQQRVAEFGVTAAQAMVMAFLAHEDNITSTRLGNLTQLDSATLTGILDRLSRAGLLERRDNPDDRRAILICLTDKGKTIGEKILQTVDPANRSFLSSLTREEELIFRTLLKKLLASRG